MITHLNYHFFRKFHTQTINCSLFILELSPSMLGQVGKVDNYEWLSQTLTESVLFQCS